MLLVSQCKTAKDTKPSSLSPSSCLNTRFLFIDQCIQEVHQRKCFLRGCFLPAMPLVEQHKVTEVKTVSRDNDLNLPVVNSSEFTQLKLKPFYLQDTYSVLYYNKYDYVATMTCSDTNIRGPMDRVIFAWYQLVIMFIIPVIVMVYCYSIVIHVLWVSTKELAKMTQTNK